MKIEIELLNEPAIYRLQMLAVDNYIRENTIKVERQGFSGITVSEKPTINQTAKGTGCKITVKDYHRKFHVSCNKTKGGIYKFKVWNA